MSLSRKRKVLPGFHLTLGFALLYLCLIVLVPLAATFAKLGGLTWPQFWHAVASPVTLAAYRLSFGASFLAALVNSVFGLLVAWVLVRYEFWGKRLMDALVDLPFALPTAVAGITLATLYAENGWIGRWLAPFGIKVSYTSIGVFVALTFVGLPFVVRTLQPLLDDFDLEIEEAAASLGATRFKTFFRVILPMIFPGLLTGFALAFARALGEYGSVVFISSNIPFKTQIVPVLIMSKLEEFDYGGATALAVVMLAVSFLLLLAINGLQTWSMRHQQQA
ncbi:MAG TPA: sulfate ABC transporter permease subunit CysT [Verrucomicrobiae bacterium]|nr:sulfate ABC transporter permease subunit CysT [Verrucomicrobiae bacterium]